MAWPDQDPTVAPLALALLACLTEEIGRVPNPPASVCLRTGDQVALMLSQSRDECCEGLAWVRVGTVYPSAIFPEQDAAPSNCGVLQWAIPLEMGVARCAPVAEADDIPDCAEWTTASLAVLDDAAAMRRAVCCFALTDPDRLYLTGAWTPLPVSGGCMGGVMTVTVAADACDCATIEEG